MDQVQTFWGAWPQFQAFAIHFAVTLIILVIGWAVSNVVGRWIRHLAARSPRIDPTVVPIVRSVTMWSIRIVVILAVLARLGVQTASLVAMLGASALAVGLALQGTLQNFAAGIMLLVLRPIRAGEFVSIVGKGDGTVDEIGLFVTRFIQADGTHLLLPNTLIWGNPIVNYSRNKTRSMDIKLAVRYDDDLERALATLKDLADHYPTALAAPAPQVLVTEYRDGAVLITVRLWAQVADYWAAYFDLQRRAPQALREAGLRAPLPLREVRSVPAPAEASRAG